MSVQQQKIVSIKEQIGKVIIGKEHVIEKVLAVILAKGHILLEDIPGVGKTTLALAFSKAMSLDYKRIQFTPDVLPSDIIGFSMYNKKTHDFEYKEGAAMSNLFLADEINRTSPKTQAALLEVMEEGKVTVDGVTREIQKPFVVIATQNPMGYVGTQKLPESQLDRFMICATMGYPNMENEIEILKGEYNTALDKVDAVISKEEIIQMQDDVSKVYVKDNIYEYIAKLINQTRESEYIQLGLSPRGGLALIRLAKALAFLEFRDYVIPEDIIDAFKNVAAHRLVINSKAKTNGYTVNHILDMVINSLPMPA